MLTRNDWKTIILATLLGALCGAAFAAGKVDKLTGQFREDDGTGKAASADLSAYLTSATAASTYGTAASVTALQARATVTEQNIALATWDLWAHLGLPGQDMVQAWVDPCQTNAGMATSTNAYFTAGKWCTATPGSQLMSQGKAVTDGNFFQPENPNKFTDGDFSTVCDMNNYFGTGWITIDLGSSSSIGSYRFRGGNYWNGAWRVQGSDNNSNWTTVDTRSGVSDPGSDWTAAFTLSQTRIFRYWKFDNWVGNQHVNMTEIQLISGDVTAAVTLRTVTSTASATPTHGSLFVCAKELEAIGLNTDVVAKLSKAGSFGAPVTLTLTKLLTIGAYSYYWGEADYAAGTGVTMAAQIETTAKGLEIYRLSHNWR